MNPKGSLPLWAGLTPAVFLTLCSPLWGDNPPATVIIDPAATTGSISPLIYGMAFAPEDLVEDLRLPVNRSGGNSQTRYNWQADATNRASDWYFESLPNDNANPGQLPHGSSTDRFYEANASHGCATILTVPMIGYVAKDRNRLCSYSIIKYGPQQDNDWQWFPDAGNGIRLDGSPITDNDPLDSHVAVGEAFMGDWVAHLVSRYGQASSGGVQYLALDNEPGLWHETHRDVRLIAPHDAELAATSVSYASTIKSADSTAMTLGYEGWGWLSLIYSPFDFQYACNTGNWSWTPDRSSGGYEFFAEYYLQELSQAEVTAGRRLLDVFTAHLYPQGGEYSNNESAAMQARRMRSTRCLWDPEYVDETWIADIIMLIPRMRAWVDSLYPGTKIGITEYNWGALGYPDGGIAQADILGIFGREGLDIGTLWTDVQPGSPGYNAFKLYTDYDDAGSGFGNVSLACSVANPDSVAAFASIDTDTWQLKVIVLNKYPSGVTPVTLEVRNAPPLGVAHVYQWAGYTPLQPLADLEFIGNCVTLLAPPYSATLVVTSLCFDFELGESSGGSQLRGNRCRGATAWRERS